MTQPEAPHLTQAVLDSMSSHIAVLDRGGHIVAVNEAWRQFARDNPPRNDSPTALTGVGADYLAACEVSMANGAVEAREIGDAIRAVIHGQLPMYSTEYPCHSPEEQRWFLMAVTPLKHESGGVVITHTPITGRKRTEDLLRREHALSSAAIDSAPGLFCKFNAKGRLLRWNGNLERLSGWDASRIADMHIFEFFADTAHVTVSAAMQAVLTGGDGSFDTALKTRTGALIPLMVNARRIELDGEDFIIFFGVDVTEKKRAADAIAHYQRELEAKVAERTEELALVNTQLAGREKFLRTITDNIPGMVAYWDKDLLCRFANRAYTNWFKFTPEQMIGVHMQALFGEEVLIRNHDRFAAVLRGEAQEYFRAILKPSGQLGSLWVHFIPDHAGDTVVGFYTLAMDVTQQKEAEHALAESQVQLRLLLERAEGAREQERQTLARDMHDDLGQLLTGMHLTISALQMRQRRTKAHVDQTVSELHGQIDLTQQVVRRIATNLRPAQLNNGLLPAIESLASDLRSKTGVMCQLSIQGEAPQLEYVATLAIYRMVQEALTNIARHARASLVLIRLVHDGKTLHLIISDDGVGFDLNALLPTEVALGLIGMRERALLIHAQLKLDSAPGKGTRIDVRVPVHNIETHS